MGLTIFQVDAFTNKPFAGNPAGVCLLPEPQDAGWMQNVAREMNLSETAFLLRQDDGYNLRWFTPAVEVDLCGHATLASAHILWEAGHLPAGEQARFHTRSGLLTADRRGEWIEMNFPAKPEEPASAPPGLAEALGVPVKYTGKSQFDYLVEVDFRRHSAQHAAGLYFAGKGTNARRYCHQSCRFKRLRFCLALFRSPGRHQRGPRHRLRTLLLEPFLEQAPRQKRAGRLPGFSPWWGSVRSPKWRPGISRRTGGHHFARGIGVKNFSVLAGGCVGAQ